MKYGLIVSKCLGCGWNDSYSLLL